MADPDRIVSQTSVKTGTEVGELCAVGICSLTTGVSLCAGEPVQPDAPAPSITFCVGLPTMTGVCGKHSMVDRCARNAWVCRIQLSAGTKTGK